MEHGSVNMHITYQSSTRGKGRGFVKKPRTQRSKGKGKAGRKEARKDKETREMCRLP
jgi:hypothetical protein